MTTEATPKVHLGRNIRHFRQESNLKQDELADRMGDPWTQKKISQLEAKATIDDSILEQVALALEVSVEEIKEYSDASVVNIQNNYDAAGNNVGPGGSFFNCTINPIDKYAEANDRLAEAYAKIEKLNDALLREKDEKIALLTKMMNERK
jgi:transcriptional regulator with XRE-family HTH domain